MTTINPQTLDVLNANNVDPDLRNKIIYWIERLDCLESFRRFSHAATDQPEAFTVQQSDKMEPETVAQHSQHIKPHALELNSAWLHHEEGPIDKKALLIVMMLRHEQRHHEVEDRTNKLSGELSSAHQQNKATLALGLDYMNVRLDSEIVARFADYRVANEAWKLAQQDGDQTLASDIRRNLMTNTELNKAFYERERELGRPLTEEEALKDFRLLTLQFEHGTYLDKFVQEAVERAGTLDKTQLREALLRDATPVHEQTIDQPVQDLSRASDGRPAMSALESKTLAEAFEHLGKPYNRGKFDAFSDQEKECLAGVAMQIGMRHVGDPKVTSDYLSSVFLSDNGKMYVSAGKFDVLQGTAEIAEAKQTSLTQSLEVSRDEHQQLLEQQRQQELTRGGPDGPGGPTMSR